MYLTGIETITVTEVALVELSGSGEFKGVVEKQESGNFLVFIDRIPSVEFAVRVKGGDFTSTPGTAIVFERQSSTNFRPSNLTITVSAQTITVSHKLHLEHEKIRSN